MKSRLSPVVLCLSALAACAAERAKAATVVASKTFGNQIVRVEEYQEDVDVVKDDVRRRSSRSVLCVNLYETGTLSAPRRAWQTCRPWSVDLFPEGRMRSFVISDLARGNFVVACCSQNDICVALVSLDGQVPPLPADIRHDANTQKFNWVDSPLLTIPASTIETGLGVKLKWGHRINVTGASRTANGWRVDVVLVDTEHVDSTHIPIGKMVVYSTKVVHKFHVFIDDACKSAEIQFSK